MAGNILADKTVQYEVFIEGDRKLGTANATLMEASFKTDTFTGAGVLGEIDMPTYGFTSSAELKLSWHTVNDTLVDLMAPHAHNLELRGAIQTRDTATGIIKMRAVKVNVRGFTKSGNFGSLEPATANNAETTLELLYYKVTIDGEKEMEVDKDNYIFYVKGKDYAADIRSALGL
ncbi:MAG: phage major tail tube protein [Schwartzia sp.]|nr:phage major tail tube protein [Schwartzia sp. (in: firmicutes)]